MTEQGNRAGRVMGRVVRIVTDRETGARRGFGFIADDANAQYYFHATDMVRGGGFFAQVTEGQRVEFEPTRTEKGPRAAHVEVASP